MEVKIHKSSWNISINVTKFRALRFSAKKLPKIKMWKNIKIQKYKKISKYKIIKKILKKLKSTKKSIKTSKKSKCMKKSVKKYICYSMKILKTTNIKKIIRNVSSVEN